MVYKCAIIRPTPLKLRRQGAGPPSGGPSLIYGVRVKTNVYIDGFNLFYGSLKGTPYRWLDIAALCKNILPNNDINRIRYFTALVKPRPDNPFQLQRQKLYLRALPLFCQNEIK